MSKLETLRADVNAALTEMRAAMVKVDENLFLSAPKLKPFVDDAVAAQRKVRKTKKALTAYAERA